MPNRDPLDFAKTMEPVSPPGAGHAATLKEGDTLGQYRIIRLLGRGGMGEVYEVEHTVLRRRYALKLLPADFATRPGALERFKREAQAMANLDHPNIVKVDDFGQADNRHWLRMELAEGGEVGDPGSEVGGRKSEVRSLAEYAEAKGGRLDPDEAQIIFSQILEGLAHAHEHGVVHRDLKPANILIFGGTGDNAQRPTLNSQRSREEKSRTLNTEHLLFKIADFGLVRMVGEEWLLSQADNSIRLSMSLGGMPTEMPSGAGTSTRSLIGTYEYMSPEQKRGEDATAASDVYAVGLMMYRLLAGRQLGMRRPSEIVPGLSGTWDALVLKAVEEEPADRFAIAGDMLAALGSAAGAASRTASPAVPRPHPPPEPPPPVPPETTGSAEPLAENWTPRPADSTGPKPPRTAAPPAAGPATTPPRRNRTGWIVAACLCLLALVALIGAGLHSRADRQEQAARARLEEQRETARLAEETRQREAELARQREEARLAEETRQREEAERPRVATETPPFQKGPGPTPGQNWRSPATGMEFVWVSALNAWVGKYEVTNGEYRKMKPWHNSGEYSGHSLNDGDRQPVVQVDFDDAKAYAAWLTEQDRAALGGARYRLPTEAEFMAYAQCGDGREYPWGNEWPPRSGQAGNYSGQESAWTYKIDGYRDGHPVTCTVEQSWANPWGLYGVGGNVWEACASNDAADQAWGGWRGASWSYFSQDSLRCSNRISYDASDRGSGIGFRLLLSR